MSNTQAHANNQASCSVVVPVFNGERLITRCLDGIATQTVSPHQYEVIIVDDGSTDGTAARVSAWAAAHPDYAVRLIRQPNAGPAAARNHGARVAQTDLILFTDADCAPQPQWIDAFLRAFADPTLIGARGFHFTTQSGLIPQFVGAEYADRFDRIQAGQAIDFIDTQSAAYRSAPFLAVGGFDTIFPTACVEDQELSFRLAGAGHYLTFAPAAAVNHLYDETLRSYWRRKYYIGYWKALMLRWHKDRIMRDSHTPQVLKVQIVLVGLLLPVAVMVALSLFWPIFSFAWLMLISLLGVLLLTTLPFAVKLSRRSWKLAAIAPFMVAVRSLASGLGLLVGAIFLTRRTLNERNDVSRTVPARRNNRTARRAPNTSSTSR